MGRSFRSYILKSKDLSNGREKMKGLSISMRYHKIA
jgi:hypothetical protein